MSVEYPPFDPATGIAGQMATLYETALKLEAQRDSERARAEKYLKAMTEYVDVSDAKEIESAYAAIRVLVEEARRG